MEKIVTTIDTELLFDSETIVSENEMYESPRQISKTRKKKKRVSVLRFYFINILLAVIILVGVGAFCAVTMFKLENIEFEGLVNANSGQIRNAYFSDKYCSNTIYAWAVNIGHRDREVPFVKEAEVYMKNPTTLVVNVKEDELFAVINNGKENIYVDSMGKISEVSGKNIENIPKIKGFKVEGKDEESLPVNAKKYDKCISILKYLKDKNIFVSEIVMDKDQTIGFMYEDIFIDIGLSENEKDIVGRLSLILPSITGQKGILHFEEWGEGYKDAIFEKTS